MIVRSTPNSDHQTTMNKKLSIQNPVGAEAADAVRRVAEDTANMVERKRTISRPII